MSDMKFIYNHEVLRGSNCMISFDTARTVYKMTRPTILLLCVLITALPLCTHELIITGYSRNASESLDRSSQLARCSAKCTDSAKTDQQYHGVYHGFLRSSNVKLP
jgi:hypothetical protein